MDIDQARRALDRGADVLIAQGGEAGGHSGFISTMTLVPQVVDAAGERPVVAAGGIADGRGLAAAMSLGASGVVMGTRFLASTEMDVDPAWKEMIIAASSADAQHSQLLDQLLPPTTDPMTRPPPESCPPRSPTTGPAAPTNSQRTPPSSAPPSSQRSWPAADTSTSPSPDKASDSSTTSNPSTTSSSAPSPKPNSSSSTSPPTPVPECKR